MIGDALVKIAYDEYQKRMKFIIELLDPYMNKYNFKVLSQIEKQKTAILPISIREPFHDRIASFLRDVFHCTVTREHGYLNISVDTDHLNQVDQTTLNSLKMALELAMPKYLMFGHEGVLAGVVVEDTSSLGDGDLSLNLNGGDTWALKNGVQIVNKINELVNNFGYEVVSHSNDLEKDQFDFLGLVQTACIAKGITFPQVRAMAVFDTNSNNISGYRTGERALITTSEGVLVATWGDADEKGKASVRRALERALQFADTDRRSHIVFDNQI